MFTYNPSIRFIHAVTNEKGEVTDCTQYTAEQNSNSIAAQRMAVHLADDRSTEGFSFLIDSRPEKLQLVACYKRLVKDGDIFIAEAQCEQFATHYISVLKHLSNGGNEICRKCLAVFVD